MLAIQSVCVFTIDYTILTFGLVLHTPGYSPVFIPSPIALDEIVGEIKTSWAVFFLKDLLYTPVGYCKASSTKGQVSGWGSPFRGGYPVVRPIGTGSSHITHR